jgi:GDPmannose 4,6-dehydratase
VEEEAIDVKSGKSVVKVDPRYFRPAEVEYVFSSSTHQKALTIVAQSPSRKPSQG